jgi:hypothetical protein
MFLNLASLVAVHAANRAAIQSGYDLEGVKIVI